MASNRPKSAPAKASQVRASLYPAEVKLDGLSAQALYEKGMSDKKIALQILKDDKLAQKLKDAQIQQAIDNPEELYIPGESGAVEKTYIFFLLQSIKGEAEFKALFKQHRNILNGDQIDQLSGRERVHAFGHSGAY